MSSAGQPNVERFLASRPEAVRALAQRLAGMGLAGVFPRYLGRVGEAELDVFFAELAAVDFEWLERHRAARTA
ncbi:hypothetical protein FJY71_09185, partial [candidate division WOR-3 bacterium]|nr:hypothetical protein [candidate division WOR-3 bacterium]